MMSQRAIATDGPTAGTEARAAECIKIADIGAEVTVACELRKSTVGVICLDGATIFKELALAGVAACYGSMFAVFAGMCAALPSTSPRLRWALAVGYVFSL